MGIEIKGKSRRLLTPEEVLLKLKDTDPDKELEKRVNYPL